MIYKGKDIDIRPGDVILYHYGFIWHDPERYLSYMNRKFTGSFYNHGGIVTTSWGRLFINEALGRGVFSRPLDRYLEREKSKLIVLRYVPQPPAEEICVKANSILGTPYDRAAFVFYQPVYRTFGCWLGTKGKGSERTMGCIEYIAWCYGRPKAYLYTSAEMMADPRFKIIYQEK
jgi:hypothetical protein